MSNGAKVVESYVSEIMAKRLTGQAGEHAYRAAFEALVKSIKPELQSVNDPKRSAHGAPDFVFLKKDATVGYAETKDITVGLDKAEKSKQLERYYGYPNLILTNYLEFRFFKNGISRGEPISVGVLSNDIIVPGPESYEKLAKALEDALSAPGAIRSGVHLAKVMGVKAQRIRDNVRVYLDKPENERNRELLKVYDIIRRLLVHDLSPSRFADLYAQTLVYGLFIARYYDKTSETFTRQEARELVPKSNPFLHDFFDHVAGNSFDTRLAWAVDELCEVFRVSDVHALMRDFYTTQNLWGETQESTDPVIHFYEDFLKEYDSNQRLDLGVFYTPLPVVRFIVRSVDEILRRDFGIAKGLADDTKIQEGKHKGVQKVQILDPAVGTGTFLKETIQFIHKRFSGQGGRWSAYVDSGLLPRLHGFEIMMASYIIAHLKLAMTLHDTGYDNFNKRLQVYLTNSLEEAPEVKPGLFGPQIGLQESLTRESIEAGNIKRDLPVMVVIGNPPYSGESQNPQYHGHDVYKKEPGTLLKLKERNSKWLNDDYVKFIHLAEDFVSRTGEGIVGMITNHGYLDNPTFRGMRWHLLDTFDDIYVLDLHGNTKKKEKAEDGSKDENVFDIQQGVAILLAVKRDVKKKKKEIANVFRSDLSGLRLSKYEFLNKNSVSSIDWQKIALAKPQYGFEIRDNTLAEVYNSGFVLSELFHVSSIGVVTARDGFVIDTDKAALGNRIQTFLNSPSAQQAATKFNLHNTQKWSAENAFKHEYDQSNIIPIQYRPFDQRYIYYHNDFIERQRMKVMRNFLAGENIGLSFHKREELKVGWAHILCVKDITEHGFTSGKTTNYQAPLYIFENGERISNLKPQITRAIEKMVGKTSPEDTLHYIYAALHSPSYRQKFAELLKRDFPRVPYPKSKEQFTALAKLGKELRELHLFETPVVDKFVTTYPEKGTNTVEKIHREGDKVFINELQYFGDVPDEAWNFLIGAYQPAQKYLKDRLGDNLTSHDLVHYQKMIVALVETSRIMKEINKVS